MCRAVQLLISRVIDPFSNSMRFICVPSQNSGSYWEQIALDGKIHRKNRTLYHCLLLLDLIGSFSNLNWSFEVGKSLGYHINHGKSYASDGFQRSGKRRSPFQVWGKRSLNGHLKDGKTQVKNPLGKSIGLKIHATCDARVGPDLVRPCSYDVFFSILMA